MLKRNLKQRVSFLKSCFLFLLGVFFWGERGEGEEEAISPPKDKVLWGGERISEEKREEKEVPTTVEISPKASFPLSSSLLKEYGWSSFGKDITFWGGIALGGAMAGRLLLKGFRPENPLESSLISQMDLFLGGFSAAYLVGWSYQLQSPVALLQRQEKALDFLITPEEKKILTHRKKAMEAWKGAAFLFPFFPLIWINFREIIADSEKKGRLLDSPYSSNPNALAERILGGIFFCFSLLLGGKIGYAVNLRQKKFLGP